MERTANSRVLGQKDWVYFGNAPSLSKWLPLLLGLGLGVLLAHLIAAQAWLPVFLLVAAIPAMILFARYPFAGVLLWLLIAPLVASPKTNSQAVIFWIPHRVMIPLALTGTLLLYLFKVKKEWPTRFGRVELSIAACLGLAILSALILSSNTLGALYKIYDRLFVAYCLYLLMRFTAPREKDLRLLVWVAVITAIFQSVVGLLANFAPEILPSLWYNARSAVRTVGTFNAPGRYTSVLIFCTFIAYQAAMHFKRKGTRGLLLFVFVLGYLMIFLTYAKASWLAGGLALIGVLILYPGPTLRVAVIIAILMPVFGVGLLSDELAYANERLQDESADTRLIANAAMWNMVKARPLIGFGYQNLEQHIDEYAIRLDRFASKHISSHNTYLPIMAEIGLVGFFLYIFPFLWWLILTIRAWPRMPKEGFVSRSLVAMLWLTIIAQFIVANFADFSNGYSGIFAIGLWWATLGLIASLVDPYAGLGDEETEK